MTGDRANTTARLRVEELESRAMMAVMGGTPDLLPTNPDGSSDLVGDGFPGQMAAIAAAAENFAVPGFTVPTDAAQVVVTNNEQTAPPLVSRAPDATTGVGQMTMTTGANTPGIGSFATSVSGFASEFGGRS